MASYDGADAVYEELGGVLSTVLENAERRAALQQTGSVLQFVLSEPDATITILARPGAPAAVGTGPTEIPVDLVLAMSADSARALLFGERTALSMMAAGEIALKGQAAKLLMVLTALVGASDVEATPEAVDVEETADAVSSEESAGEEDTANPPTP